MKAAVAMMSDAEKELPYEGAKEMLLVDDVENKEFSEGQKKLLLAYMSMLQNMKD